MSYKIANFMRGMTPEEEIARLLSSISETHFACAFFREYQEHSSAQPRSQVYRAGQLRTALSFAPQTPVAAWTAATIAEISCAIAEHGYSEAYQGKLYSILRRYAAWLVTTQRSPHLIAKDIPERPRTAPPASRVTPDDLYTEQQVRRIIEYAAGPMQQAFLAVMYYGALRVHEAANLLWQDVQEEENGITYLITNGKTGITREIPLSPSATHRLREWQAEDAPTSPDAFVFHQQRRNAKPNQPLRYHQIWEFTHAAVRRAGFDPTKFHTHLLRHSKVTQMVATNLNEKAVAKIAWGTQNSTMLQVYTHLGKREIATMMKQVGLI